MSFLQPFFWDVVLLGAMILIHEFGHYWAALSVGVKVETFSLGFGPRLFGFKRGDTDFRVSAVFFGGYVRMLGELPGDDKATDPRSLQAKSRWQRAIVVAAGPLMNILLAVAILTGLYMYAFPKDIDSTDPIITSISPNSPAARAGLQPEDKIVEFNGKKDPNWQDVLTQSALNANRSLPVVVVRNGRRLTFSVTPKLDPTEGVGLVGWSGQPDVQLAQVVAGSPAAKAGLRPGDLLISANNRAMSSIEAVLQEVTKSHGKPVEFIFMRNGQIEKATVTPTPTSDPQLPWHMGVLLKMRGEVVKLGFGPALVESIRSNARGTTLMFEVLRSLVERRVSARNTIAGPIGMAKMSGEAAQEGPFSFLALMAVVSLNLAIINLLPIPILDGGTLLMLAIEMLLQREVSLQMKETIFKVGFVFLMMVVVFVIYNDISRLLTNS